MSHYTSKPNSALSTLSADFSVPTCISHGEKSGCFVATHAVESSMVISVSQVSRHLPSDSMWILKKHMFFAAKQRYSYMWQSQVENEH